MEQSTSLKTRESKLLNTKEQSRKGLNLAATSARGRVTAAPTPAAPELDSMPVNKHVSDKRFVVLRWCSPWLSVCVVCSLSLVCESFACLQQCVCVIVFLSVCLCAVCGLSSGLREFPVWVSTHHHALLSRGLYAPISVSNLSPNYSHC